MIEEAIAMKVLGYGEDFLTFWAINKKLDRIFNQLKDKTDPEECIVFYRPSFGRKGGTIRAEFGEFDAIIVTPKTAYLVESKWDGSNASFKDNILKLEEVQIRRHKIFRWYHENWKKENWTEFIQKHDYEFRKDFGKNIAPAEELAQQKPADYLKRTQRKELIDVLLFFHRREPPKIETSFKIVTLKYRLADGEYTKLA